MYFNTTLSTMHRSSTQRISKDIVALKDTLDQMDIINIYRNFDPKEAKYTFFSISHGTFSKTDHMAGSIQNKLQQIQEN